MINKLTVMLAVFFIFPSFLHASTTQYQKSKAPKLVLTKPSSESGNLLVKVFGTDALEDEFKDKIRLFIVPSDIWQAKTDIKFINDYLVDISNSRLITDIKPGSYIIGISTQYRPSFSFTGAGMEMEMPNDFYSWDGWTESPSLEHVNKKMYHITWYSGEIVSETTALIVAIRIKRGKNINEILSSFEPAQPPFTVAVKTEDQNLKNTIEIVRKYGKAFLKENRVFFVQDTTSGDLSELRIVEEGTNKIAIPTNIDVSDTSSPQNELIIKNGTTNDTVVRIKEKASNSVVGEQMIPAGKSGTIKLPPGEYYEVAKFQLKSGDFIYSKGGGFSIKPDKYSKLVMTLHPVINGNYHSYSCSAKDFD